MRGRVDFGALAGFVLAGAFAVTGGWSLQEFCWSTWLAGLLYAWGCAATGAVGAILTAPARRPWLEERAPWLKAVGPVAYSAGVAVVAAVAAGVMFYLYAVVFAFYGLFLSFFAEMEPHSLFGRNGFINSDFYTPVVYLAVAFWPMAVGTWIANGQGLLRTDPWKRLLVPSVEIVRVHVLVVAMPFLALVAWMLLGESYHTVTILALMALFYLLPGAAPARPATAANVAA